MSPEEFDHEVSQLEVNLDRLRALYEQYFLGIERIEPSVARKTVDRQFWQLKRVTMRNTARRFRFQTLVQRYNTLQQHWMKVCRQIENGTYPRHVKRAKQRHDESTAARKPNLRAKESARSDAPAATPSPIAAPTSQDSTAPDLSAPRVPTEFGTQELNSPSPGGTPPHATRPQPPPRRKKPELPVQREGTPTSEPMAPASRRISLRPISDNDVQKIRSSIPPAPPLPRGAPPQLKRQGPPRMIAQSNAAQNITDERVDGLYQELQRVRRRLNQDEMDISVEALSRSLRATEARLRAKYAGKRIDFRVEVFNGKAVIKPTVKK